jgi:hypothetical protein
MIISVGYRFAEDQARHRKQGFMKDREQKLDVDGLY